MTKFQSVLLVTLLSILVVFCAYKKKLLGKSGLIALAMLLVIGGVLGNPWVLLFYAIFIFSAAFTGKVSKDVKVVSLIVKKTGARDWIQVLANGLPSFAVVILFRITKAPEFLVVFTVAVGQACADTWASDIGVKSKKKPISITTLKPVNRGESGGISVLGTCSALICACMYGVLGKMAFRYEASVLPFIIVMIVVGVMVDSLLGATIQVHYKCVHEGESILSEIESNQDGTRRDKARGLRLVNNDVVNFLSGVCTCLLTGALLFLCK